MLDRPFVFWTGALVVALFIAAFFTFVGFRAGSHTLASGVPTVEMAKIGLRMKLGADYEGPRVAPIWLPDGERFVFNAADKGGVNFQLVDPASNKRERFLEGDALSRALSALFSENISPNPFPIATFSFIDNDQIEFEYRGRLVRYHLTEGAASFVSGAPLTVADPLRQDIVQRMFPSVWADDRELRSPDRNWVLGYDDDALYLRDRNGARKTLAPINEEEYTQWSLNNSHWSSDSRYAAVFQINTQDTAKVPIVDWREMAAAASYNAYPTVVGKNMTFNGVFFDTVEGTNVTVQFEEEVYIRPLTWRVDGSEFLYASLSRDASEMKILAASPDTGEVRTVLSQKTDTFHMYPPDFFFRSGPPFFLLPDGDRFAWITDETGYRQLYLHELDGPNVQQLTDHPFDVATYGGYDPASGQLLYTAQSNAERPYDIHVHAVSAEGGGVRRLSEADGQHEIIVSPNGRYYVDKYSTTAKPPIVELRSTDGSLLFTLSEGKRRLGADMIAPPPEHFTAKAADGETDLYGVIYKPSNFDPKKKYPVIDAIYGGAFINNVPYKYDARVPFFGKELAELGFVVVAVDARGTPGRGKAFKDIVHKNLGAFEIDDHVAAIKGAAGARPWMDTSRVGILGHSFGGYFTVRAMLQAPDFYKVGVASGVPEMDRDASSIANEAFTGLVDGDPDAFFAKFANAPLAANLKGELLLVVQTSDVNTPAHGAFKLADAFIKAGKPYDMLVLPGANHAFVGSDRRYFFERMAAYFKEHL